MCDLVVARAASSGRGGRSVRRGTVLCADDPVVLERPHIFMTYQVQHHCAPKAPVETMTAAPGEQREVPPYRCDQCDATAKSPAGLAAHKRSHSGDSDS